MVEHPGKIMGNSDSKATQEDLWEKFQIGYKPETTTPKKCPQKPPTSEGDPQQGSKIPNLAPAKHPVQWRVPVPVKTEDTSANQWFSRAKPLQPPPASTAAIETEVQSGPPM